MTSTISLNAQSVNSQSGYNSSPSNPSANSNAWNSNASNSQNRTSASTWKSNQSTQGMWDAHVSTSPNHDPNQPYTQPSNLPTSYNDSRDNKFWTWTDEEIAQKIRWSIRDDKSLSTLAKSTEVTVKDKNVTLSGTVDNESEKIESLPLHVKRKVSKAFLTILI
ncbi:MAG: BON domain-containing protein [Parachlamydiaceae bacterium]|nr:MAG: BON domain-containing protein [Parachlamydiaceae bacterium]